MPTIESKKDLIAALHQNREKLLQVISKLNAEQLNKPGVCGEWSGKDVLAHLLDWQERNIQWIAMVRRGEEAHVPAMGFTWKPADVDRLNRVIFETHRCEPLEEILRQLDETNQRFLNQLDSFSEEELKKPGFMPFTGKKGTLLNWYKHYVFHDGWGRSLIYNNLLRKPRKVAKQGSAGNVA